MRKDRIQGLLILVIIVLSLEGGCTTTSPDGGAGDLSPAPLPFAIPAASLQHSGLSKPVPPSVYITSPDFDGGISAGNITVTVQIRNFSLVQESGGSRCTGIGHIIYFLDVTPGTVPGAPAGTRPGTFQVSDQASCIWYNVPPGTHTFSVELVNNDNTPLIPAVIDAVDVTAVGQAENPTNPL